MSGISFTDASPGSLTRDQDLQVPPPACGLEQTAPESRVASGSLSTSMNQNAFDDDSMQDLNRVPATGLPGLGMANSFERRILLEDGPRMVAAGIGGQLQTASDKAREAVLQLAPLAASRQPTVAATGSLDKVATRQEVG